jgi:hypothetical protein
MSTARRPTFNYSRDTLPGLRSRCFAASISGLVFFFKLVLDRFIAVTVSVPPVAAKINSPEINAGDELHPRFI